MNEILQTCCCILVCTGMVKILKPTECGEESTECPDEQGQSHTACIDVNSFRSDKDPTANHGAHNEGYCRHQTNTPSQVNPIFLPFILSLLARHVCFSSRLACAAPQRERAQNLLLWSRATSQQLSLQWMCLCGWRFRWR